MTMAKGGQMVPYWCAACDDAGCTECEEPKPAPPEVPVMRKVLTNPQIDATDCVRCHGAGMRGPDEPCPVCEGTGGEPRYTPEVPAPDEVWVTLDAEGTPNSVWDWEQDARNAQSCNNNYVTIVRYVRAREGGR